MQATTPNPSAPVIAKAFQGATSVTVTGADGKTQTLMVPRSAGEMTELMARRRELTDELDNVTERRNDVVMQLRTAPNVAQAGLTAQLQVLNNRIVQLETDLAATERQLSAASPELATISVTRYMRSSMGYSRWYVRGLGADGLAEVAASDRQSGADDVGRFVGGEEEYGCRLLFQCGVPLEV